MLDYEMIWKLDPNTPEGQAIISEMLINTVFTEEKEEYSEYIRDMNAFNDYIKGITLARSLEKQGKCTVESDNAMRQYEIHTLRIQWTEEDGFIEPPTREMEQLCHLFDDLLISTSESPFWQFSKTIYKPLSAE